MKTSRALLNERTKKKSTFHKVCTYENPTTYLKSRELHGYEYTHVRSPQQQLVFHKEEIRLTPISLPTPPASPEVWGNSLQKWYQKKPLFTLTAKGQVKRIEKYLEIQKTLEICKREYEIQKHTEDMKRAYLDFQLTEHEDKNDLYEYPGIPSRREYMDFAPIEQVSSSEPNMDTFLEDQDIKHKEVNISSYLEIPRVPYPTPTVQSENEFTKRYGDKTSGSVQEDRIIKSKVVRDGAKDIDDRSVQKIIMKNKLDISPNAKYSMRLLNYGKNEDIYHLTEKLNCFHDMPNIRDGRKNSAVPKINVGNVDKLPFDTRKVGLRNSSNGYDYNKNFQSCRCPSANNEKNCVYRSVEYDINKNEISGDGFSINDRFE